MKELKFEDVYSPVESCNNCGNDLLLEPCGDSCRDLQVKCWACGYSCEVNLDFLEKHVKRLYPSVQTWRIRRTAAKCPDGLVVFGKNLFITTDIRRTVVEKLNYHGISIDKQKELETFLEETENREEAIDIYYGARDIKNAYHYAASDHKCVIRNGYSSLNCRDMVNWISSDPYAIYGEHFNIYGMILKAWKMCCQEIKSGEIDARNETEIRCLFVERFRSVAENQYKVWFGLDRKIYVNGEKLKPDAQIPALVVIEFKSFFDEQKYTCRQAASLVVKDIEKLEKYKGRFKVGFLLCFTQKFSKQKLMENHQHSFSYPVRVLVCGGPSNKRLISDRR